MKILSKLLLVSFFSVLFSLSCVNWVQAVGNDDVETTWAKVIKKFPRVQAMYNKIKDVHSQECFRKTCCVAFLFCASGLLLGPPFILLLECLFFYN